MKKNKIICLLLILLNLLAIGKVKAQKKIFKFKEIVVTASKYEEKLSNTVEDIEIIKQKEIERKNAKNVADLLKENAGIQINDNGGYSGVKTISIRGVKSRNVLILIDGQETNNLLTGTTDLSQIPINYIKRIEILKGASPIYGADTLGGVVNIITKSGTDELRTNMEIGYGSFNTQQYSLTQQGGSEKLNYNLALTAKKSDGYRDVLKNSALEQYNLFTKFDYQLNKYSNLIFSLGYNDSDKGIPGPSNNLTPKAQQKDENNRINLKWERKKEKNNFKMNVYYNKHNQIYNNPDSSFPKSEHDSFKKGLELIGTKYYENNTLNYGIEIKENIIDSTNVGNHNHLNKSVFVSEYLELNKKTKITISGRYDDYEKFSSNFNPKVGMSYNINPKIKYFFSASDTFTTPTFSELYWGKWSNPNLKPESATSYETGLRLKKNNSIYKVNYFKKDVGNLIEWNDYEEESYNINKAKISGVELILNEQITKNTSLNFNYTYLNAINIKTNERLPNRPYNKSNIKLFHENNQYTISLIGEYIGERKSNRKTNLPSYFIIDTKFSKNINFKNQNIKIVFEINNLLNKEYENIEFYPMPERNYSLLAKLKF